MTGQMRLTAVVRGRVQGVYFRAFVREAALRLGITGFVRNLPDPTRVEIEAEGDKARLDSLLEEVKVGPPGAKVENVEARWSDYRGGFNGFEIRY
ncbi:MAG: acylphosphatase [Chloroflexi bacterium]|nr:acylphosphatase [Chloroflexota bacterium]